MGLCAALGIRRPAIGALSDDLCAFRRWRGFGAELRFFERVGSTNDLALEAGMAGAAEGLVILADAQTEGRGRLHRTWSAPPGTSLLLSVLFRPPAPFAASAPLLPMVCGLALHAALTQLTPLSIRLKWPNDAIVERRDGTWGKVAGILSEVGMVDGAPAFLVVGMGVNVNIPSALLPGISPTATSLLAELGEPVSRSALLEALLAALDVCHRAFRAGDDMRAAWQSRLAWLGEQVELHTPTGLVIGRAEDVAPDGALCIRMAEGQRRCFTVGDVSLRPR